MMARWPYGFTEGGSIGYRITHSYNEFDNMTGQAHQDGIIDPDIISAYGTTWLNNRNQDAKIGQDGYDKAGNMKSYDNRTYVYNSVGKPVSLSDLNLSYAYDGDGLKVREVRTSPPLQGVPANLLNYTTYFVRSAVLEGNIVMELDGSSQRKWDYIYGVGGRLLAEHNPTGQEMPGHKFGPRDIPEQPQGTYLPYIPPQPNKVLWYHASPHDVMAWATRTDGTLIRQNVDISFDSYTDYEIQERDLAGNIVDFKHVSRAFAHDQAIELLSRIGFISPDVGNAFNAGSGCTVDGIQTSCDIALSIANSAAAKSVQVSQLLSGGPRDANPFGAPVLFASYLDDEIEYEKYDPETGDLSGYGYLPIFRTKFTILSPPGSEGAPEPQNPTPGTIKDLKNSIYGNNELLKKINDCLRKLLGKNFNKVGEQTLANAPKIDARLTSAEISAKYTGGESTYAAGVGHVGGRYGTIFIGKEWLSNPTDWTINGRGGQPGRTPLQNAYVHELGNLASYIASGGTTYKLFGAKPNGGLVPTDDDSGYALQACVFNEPINMKQP